MNSPVYTTDSFIPIILTSTYILVLYILSSRPEHPTPATQFSFPPIGLIISAVSRELRQLRPRSRAIAFENSSGQEARFLSCELESRKLTAQNNCIPGYGEAILPPLAEN